MGVKVFVSVIYLLIVFFLGYKGWKETKRASDYLLAGRGMNPFVMAMSYGATFISTSAIIGFGGAAGMFGLPLLWLTFLNIFVGIFIAMVYFGKRTRRLGVALDSHTFPELLGQRYQSRFIQGFSGAVIFLFIPVYGAAVLIGIARLMEVYLGIPYVWGIVGFSTVLCIYVVTGGLKGVMYTEAFQGSVMFIMMAMFIVWTYTKLNGVTEAHQALTDLSSRVPEALRNAGMIGWTQGTAWGSPLWWTIYSTIIFGVGIGVLAQPQLAVRFMTVKSDREINRSVLYGGIFILMMTGVAFMVGALSNVVFFKETGKIAIQMAEGNVDKIIPAYIEKMMPGWFGVLFLLAMFSAAMSTLASQYHAGGTALGRDFYQKGLARSSRRGAAEVSVAKVGVFLTIVATAVWGLFLPESIIALATAFFFGLCSSTFLPSFLLGLYWKGMTRMGATVSMIAGFGTSLFYLTLIHRKEAAVIGLANLITGKGTLIEGTSWRILEVVDPNVIALPVSFLLAVLVSLLSSKMDQKHVDFCWRHYY